MYAWERVNIRTGKGTAPKAVTFPTKVGVVIDSPPIIPLNHRLNRKKYLQFWFIINA